MKMSRKSKDSKVSTFSKKKGCVQMAKHTKKDGGTKQKGKNKPSQKTSGSANGQNGYH
jgi:hypothetical protein